MTNGAVLCRLFDVSPRAEGEACDASKLRLPAHNRSNKVFNVSTALTAMGRAGVHFLDSADAVRNNAKLVVDKNSEGLRDVLWAFATQGVMPVLAPVDAVRDETARVHVATASAAATESEYDPCSAQLLQWVAAVGAEHRVSVRDLGRSLKDGRALCCGSTGKT